MKLFTYPYAFGTSTIYSHLEKALSPYLNVEHINYPGHGTRVQEKLIYLIEELAADAIKEIKKTNEDYALLGYSMGAKICCEVVRQLQGTAYKQPKHLFLLASPPPSKKAKISQNGEVDLEEAKRILLTRGNTPKEIVESKELMEFFHPMIKADVEALESYYLSEWPFPKMDIPITIINGKEDEVIESDWKTFFPADTICDFVELEGGHFFLFENEDHLLRLKKMILNKLC
ncbi:MAG: thioesterase domain-containing protein [Defluviitaleaceae bacterium]|nr:thioesterase domain-containing protein [Defluviitaleaceae bacterium]